MRKHFLLLILLSLLPLAGFAADLSYDIVLNRTQLDYTGKKTAPVIVSAMNGVTALTEEEIAALTPKFYKATAFDGDGNPTAFGAVVEAEQVRNSGWYLYSVTSGGNELAEAKRIPFKINKGELSITLNTTTSKVYGEADPNVLEFEWANVTGLEGDDDYNNVVITFTYSRENNSQAVNLQGYVLSNIKATTANYNVNVDAGTVKLIITKAPLTVTYDEGHPIVKSYGDANPVLAAFTSNKWDFEGWKYNDEANKATLLANKLPTYTVDKEDANTTKDATATAYTLLTGQQLRNLNFTSITLDNYEVSALTNKMLIKQVNLDSAATGVTISADTTAFTYNAAVQTPTFTVKYKNAQNEVKTLIYTDNKKEFTVAYKLNDAEVVVGEPKTANAENEHYTAEITGAINFVGTITAASNVSGASNLNFTIAKKDLWIYAKDTTKVYDAKAFHLDDVEFEYNGLLQADRNNLSQTGISAEYETAAYRTNPPVNVTTTGYAIKPKTTPDFDLALGRNYNANKISSGKIFITPRPIKVTAKPQTINFGAPAPQFAVTTAFVDIEPLNVNGKRGIALALGNNSNHADSIAYNAEVAAVLDAVQSVGLTAGTYDQATTYEKAIVVTPKTPATGNYTVTGVPANYNILAGNFTIIAKNVTLTYDGAAIEKKDLEILQSPEMGVTKDDLVFTFTNTDANDKTAYTESNMPKNAGVYDINITLSQNYVKPTNVNEPTLVPGTLTIKKAELHITPADLDLNVGATEATLNKDYNKNLATVTGKQPNDNVAWKLVFNTAENQDDEDYDPVELDNNKKLTDNQTHTYGHGISAIFVDATAQAPNDNANYVLVADSADIAVLATKVLILDKQDEYLAGKISDNIGDDYTVKFANTTTKIGEWYAMVLPFEVDPLKMVQAFDRYVIFNVLNTAGTKDGNFKFTLTMSPIPAGHPFLIKFASKADDNVATAQPITEVKWDTVFNAGLYGTVSIKEVITPTTTPYVDFDGTYTAGEELQGLSGENGGDKVWWLANSSIKKPNTNPVQYYDNNWKKPKTNKRILEAMEAYLTAEGKTWTTYAPTITVEDFDGNVTSIKSLSVDQINGLNVKGMYNLNGMKMNNVPTQKGVYIINGKKVVIK